MNRITKLGLALVGVVAASTAGVAGFWNVVFPIIGGASYCASSVNANCVQTIPAGPPAITGNETVPMDTNLSGGQFPQTAIATTATLAAYGRAQAGISGFVNALACGDFGNCQMARGTSQASDITSSVTYGPDFWAFKGGGSSAINWSKQTGAADIPGTGRYGASLRFQRKSANADVTKLCMAQVLESKDSYRFEGHTAVLQFNALAGANFSAASSQIQVVIASGSDTDGSMANFFTAGWTNYASAVVTPYYNNANSSSVANNVPAAGLLQPITTTWGNYSFSAPIPVFATGTTPVSQIGVEICFTPVGTAGTADWIELAGIQLSVNDAGTPIAFDHRPAQAELAFEQRRAWSVTEPAASVSISGSGQGASTTTCLLSIKNPVTMRAVPTLTALGTALSTSTWTVTHVVTNTALATPFLAGTTGGSTPDYFNLTATVASGLTAGQTCTLTGAAGGSILLATADL